MQHASQSISPEGLTCNGLTYVGSRVLSAGECVALRRRIVHEVRWVYSAYVCIALAVIGALVLAAQLAFSDGVDGKGPPVGLVIFVAGFLVIVFIGALGGLRLLLLGRGMLPRAMLGSVVVMLAIAAVLPEGALAGVIGAAGGMGAFFAIAIGLLQVGGLPGRATGAPHLLAALGDIRDAVVWRFEGVVPVEPEWPEDESEWDEKLDGDGLRVSMEHVSIEVLPASALVLGSADLEWGSMRPKPWSGSPYREVLREAPANTRDMLAAERRELAAVRRQAAWAFVLGVAIVGWFSTMIVTGTIAAVAPGMTNVLLAFVMALFATVWLFRGRARELWALREDARMGIVVVLGGSPPRDQPCEWLPISCRAWTSAPSVDDAA
jgi:hypothetical protein